MSTQDTATEIAIVAAGANVAPRVTLFDIEDSIVAEYHFTADKATVGCPQLPELALITVCVLILRNGHRIVGVNEGPVSAANFDPAIGRRLAREKAVHQIWPLMGYELCSQLAGVTPAFGKLRPCTCGPNEACASSRGPCDRKQ